MKDRHHVADARSDLARATVSRRCAFEVADHAAAVAEAHVGVDGDVGVFERVDVRDHGTVDIRRQGVLGVVVERAAVGHEPRRDEAHVGHRGPLDGVDDAGQDRPHRPAGIHFGDGRANGVQAPGIRGRDARPFLEPGIHETQHYEAGAGRRPIRIPLCRGRERLEEGNMSQGVVRLVHDDSLFRAEFPPLSVS
jgi:hypothetical protein